MCPLVNNLGLDSGDEVQLGSNPLDTNSCTVCITQLECRGVNVGHGCSGPGPGCCVDLDEDGYGDPANPVCDYPWVDCDDTNPSVNPGAVEGPDGDPTCSDELDNDCDGAVDDEDSACEVDEVDADGDCLPDHLDPCPLDQDCDDDGLIDGNCFSGDLSGQDSRVIASGECVGSCATEDLNNNGLVDFGETDPRLFDTDGDGISDGVERGLVEPPIPEATDPLVFVPDTDPSTTTDPTKPDTDGDGIPDGVEDSNHNGQIDEGETDPNVGEGDNGSQCSGSALASTHQASTVYGSKVLTRHLAYLLLPVGVAILLTSRRRRK